MDIFVINGLSLNAIKMKRLILFAFGFILILVSNAQTGCVNYTLQMNSNIAMGGPNAVAYNILNANQSIQSGSMIFNDTTLSVVDTFCISGACNLTLYIDPASVPVDGSFQVQISAFGMPLQFFDYQMNNGLIVATFCATIPCPTSIQVQESTCDSYTYYVAAYLPASSVDWNFGDGSLISSGNPYQSHTYADNGLYVTSATVHNPGCGQPYTMLATVNVDCPVVPLCPSQLILDTLSCSDYYLHFDTPAPGSVQWQIDGNTYNTTNAELYLPFENGWHEIIAFYTPTGNEGCTMGGCATCPITFYDTVTVNCNQCQSVFIGLTSVPDLGGTGSVVYTLSTLDGNLVDQNQAGFSANNPVVELNPCLADDCYLLHICSPTPLSDSNFVVDAVDPLIVYQSNYFNVFGCYGLDVVLSLNTDCAPPPPIDTCDGERLRWNTTATYLTMPPVFNPDTVLWAATDYLGNVLGQGDFVFTDGNPVFSDSVCAPLPLSCYTLHLTSSDVLWGATYWEVDASMQAVDFNNVWMNVANPDLTMDFVLDESVCTIDVSERGHSKLAIYPIPARDQLNIKSDQKGVWMIMDMGGRIVTQSKSAQSGNQNIDVSQMASGMYHLRWISDDSVEVISFVKE